MKFTCTQNIETLHRQNLKQILNTLKTRDFKLSTVLDSGTGTFNKFDLTPYSRQLIYFMEGKNALQASRCPET